MTRSNIHLPERMRMKISASMSLATVLRFVEPRPGRRVLAPGQPGGQPSIKASIKAKTPVIVHDQGISRHTAKIRSASARWPPGAWHWEVHVHPSPFAPLRLCAFALKPDHRPSIKASIKAKNPAIVHHQGISRQTVKFRSAPVRWTPGAWNLELRLPRPSAFICGSSPGCGPCSRVWRISRLSSHWGYWRFSV